MREELTEGDCGLNNSWVMGVAFLLAFYVKFLAYFSDHVLLYIPFNSYFFTVANHKYIVSPITPPNVL